ncbi:MAG: signal recognition particle-docking protein FtsY [Galactobacillus timonensis]|jgi:fused signal recognition particle receptor|uniref:signal recognition particle-docking protein FtsY n=1 Tax=Galactobacillus timonensis TaxID=2041840 RepID=UPI000C8424F4|nr:signal recognition particle-docking protein FtsY [Galactobacillus timonensis]MDY5222676.1 signal recognition particle-docking protein FtsY [Lachnospiraceae bacterium]MDY6282625.1 signal recognition particle-docking protein FtsY [Erysipelotrichaceae bacterium]MCI6068218.1 signal recognition particle-docking protein FtsY [Galactobacillus timonensis]MCI6755007.1 signal recognition particle-docking protein FtsY [Galactobacillus timonensis]MDD5851140.1 signal recognition particle-docking protein
MSILDSLKSIFQKKDDKAVYLSGFKKSKDSLQEKSSSLKKNFKGVDDEFLEQLEIVLLESDIGVETADAICENMKKTADEYVNVSWKWAVNFVIQSMKDLYEEVPDEPIRWNENGPTVIFLEGVNGSGKTTTAAKLTAKYQAEGKKVALVAADTFRAGAIDQLDTWAERLNVPCIKGRENGDPSAAIVDGCRYAKENNIDVLLCDTAGRLQNKAGLMAELGKMNRVAGREIPGAPHNTWLVLDATTGQNGLRQAELFDAATDLSGIILTKMDGTAKGGIVIGIKQKLHLPVLFIGLGEKKEDLRPFDLDSYLYSISQGLDDAG